MYCFEARPPPLTGLRRSVVLRPQALGDEGASERASGGTPKSSEERFPNPRPLMNRQKQPASTLGPNLAKQRPPPGGPIADAMILVKVSHDARRGLCCVAQRTVQRIRGQGMRVVAAAAMQVGWFGLCSCCRPGSSGLSVAICVIRVRFSYLSESEWS